MCRYIFTFISFVLKAGGGLAGIDAGLAQNLPGVYDDLFSKYSPGTLLSFWILVGFGTLGLPQTAVRSMGFKIQRVFILRCGSVLLPAVLSSLVCIWLVHGPVHW